MSQPNQITLTIGVPAHNEAQNIENLLVSIFRQKLRHAIVEKVIVMCDGCTDSTSQIAQKMQKKHPQLVVIDDGKKKGKAGRLNDLFQLSESEYFLTLDADIIFKGDGALEALAQAALAHPDATVLSPRYYPVPADTFWGKCAVVSYQSFETAIELLHRGNNIFALMGCCTMVKKSLYKSVHYPKNVVSDQNYLYMHATLQHPQAFCWVREAGVYFRTVNTFQDWRILGTRSVKGDKESVFEHFGDDARRVYIMPKKYVLWGLIKWFFKSPIYTTGSTLLNIYIRLFPYQTSLANGQWEMTTSSKQKIENLQ